MQQPRGRVLAVSSGSVWSLGWLATWLARRGLAADVVRPYAGEVLPARIEHDGLIVLPGSVGVYADDVGPWLGGLRRAVCSAVERGVPTLGLCFGAQLLATVSGGTVARVDGPGEFGVRWIRRTSAPDRLLGDLPGHSRALLWHDEAVTELPRDATTLCENEVCIQGFRIGDRAWGMQFHPEATMTAVRRWARLYAETLWTTEAGAREKIEEFAEVRAELVATWRPVVDRFADLVVESLTDVDGAAGSRAVPDA